ncbi:MAG: ATP-grasp fold amidoligase family protein, partial [Bdellovibrionales bacterium]
VPEDYKLFVYDGRVHFIQVIQGRFDQEQHSFLDREWNLLSLATTGKRIGAVEVPRNAKKIVEIAEKIGSGFDFVRVDLYNVAEKIYFSEATFYPAGGYKEFSPASWDKVFGAPWVLPALKNG